MHLFRCQRQVSKCGGSTYIPIPRQAMLDLRLFVGDWVEVVLDAENHQVTLRALQRRDVQPMPGPRQNVRDMVPDQLTDPPRPTLNDPRQRELVEAG